VTFIQFDTQSPYYQQMLALRHQELRKPLGLDLYKQDLSSEPNYWHFGLVRAHQLIACVMIVPVDKKMVILKQMAVCANEQGQGLGLALIGHLEGHLFNRNIETIELSARVSALGFYQKIGYQIQGSPYIDVGIEHQLMTKTAIQPLT